MLCRFLNMENHTYALLLLITFAVVSESNVIVPRSAPEESSPDVAEFEKDKTLNWNPAKWDPAGLLPKGFVPEPDDDLNEIDEGKVDTKFPEHDESPEYDGETEKEIDDAENKPAPGDFPGPFDGDEDLEKPLGGEKDSKFPGIEDKELDKPAIADSDEPPLLEGDDKPDDVDESHKDEEGLPDEDEEGKEEPGPVDEFDVDLGGKGMMPGYFGTGSIFDTPFFNLDQVRKYFHQLESALQHVFRQTVDEAMLLNGTYANTKEEEVEINGKKYIVHKSVIKGGDNDSSIYVETLSSKPKMDVGKETNNTNDKRR